MFIKEIVPLPLSKKKNRFRVRLEEGTDFVLYKKEIDRYSLAENTELTPDTYSALLEEIFIPRAKARALHLLEKQDRTRQNLMDKLRESGYPTEAIEIAVAYVSDYNYINDLRYTQNYIRSKSTQKSKRRIYSDLANKGIDKSVINEAVCLLETDMTGPVFDDNSLIRDYINRKLSGTDMDDKARKKVFDHLLRAGFSSSDIMGELKLFDSSFEP